MYLWFSYDCEIVGVEVGGTLPCGDYLLRDLLKWAQSQTHVKNSQRLNTCLSLQSLNSAAALIPLVLTCCLRFSPVGELVHLLSVNLASRFEDKNFAACKSSCYFCSFLMLRIITLLVIFVCLERIIKFCTQSLVIHNCMWFEGMCVYFWFTNDFDLFRIEKDVLCGICCCLNCWAKTIKNSLRLTRVDE